VAGEAELKRYEEALANCTIAAATLGGLDLEKLPGPEALQVPGDSDGQTRVVREGKKAFAYAWSAAGGGKWEPVGEVVDGPGQTMGGEAAPAGKQTLNGKTFDFVFDIEIEAGKVAGGARGGNRGAADTARPAPWQASR
jgi:phospholipase A-2-activating protein